MKLVKNLAAQTQADLLDLAVNEFNFFGKRTRETRLSCAELILREVGLIAEVEIVQLTEWLLENKPAASTASTKTAKANKPAANTMTGNQATKREAMQVFDESRFYLITSAQNNTAVNPKALSMLLSVCDDIGAELIALPSYYNKNAYSPAVKDEREYFDEAIKPYMLFDDAFLFSDSGVKLCAEAAVLPTAKLPVNAAKLLNTGEGITIVGSPKQQFSMMPVLPDLPIKAAASTGTVTQYNYRRGRAGSESEPDHKYGALLVWVQNEGIQFTNLQIGDDGSLEYYLVGEQLQNVNMNVSAKLGDLHCEMFDPVCWDQTLKNLKELQPARVAVEDILHFSSRSHHNRHSGKHLYSMQGVTVQSELTQVINQLNQLAAIVPDVYVTESNHNSALDVWLDDRTYNAKFDACNSKLYYLLNWAVCEMLDDDESDKVNALQLALELEPSLSTLPALADNIRFGRGDVSEKWNGTEISQHGHKGQNGSFGSPALFAKWGFSLATGHTHSPNLIGNVITCGVTANKKQGYNRLGASSWGQADALIHGNGTQQLVFKELFSY